MCKLVHLFFWHWSITTALAATVNLSITGSTQLDAWERNGSEKIYNYVFSEDVHYVVLRCVFEITSRIVFEYLKVSFFLDGVLETETHRSHDGELINYFRIEKQNKIISCQAETTRGPWMAAGDNHDHYTSVVNLHYQPPAPEQTRGISNQSHGPDGTTLKPRQPDPKPTSAPPAERPDHYTKSTTLKPRQPDPKPTSAPPAERPDHYTKSPVEFELNITGPPKLIFWKKIPYMNIYNYSYSGDEMAEFNCTYDTRTLDPDPVDHTIFSTGNGSEAACYNRQCTGVLSHKFELHRGIHNITCEAKRIDSNYTVRYMWSVVMLQFVDTNTSLFDAGTGTTLKPRQPDPKPTSAPPAERPDHYTKSPVEFELNITGPPKLVFWKKIPFKNIYNYSYSGDEKAEFNCTYDTLDPDPVDHTIFSTGNGSEAACYNRQCTGVLSHKFELHRGIHNITCEAKRIGSNYSVRYMWSVVMLQYVDTNTSLFDVGTAHTDTGARVSAIVWVTSAVAVTFIIIAALITVILKYRSKVRELERNRIPGHIRSRPPLTLPPEIVYDDVYSHGAGLWRPPLKPLQ